MRIEFTVPFRRVPAQRTLGIRARLRAAGPPAANRAAYGAGAQAGRAGSIRRGYWLR